MIQVLNLSNLLDNMLLVFHEYDLLLRKKNKNKIQVSF